MNLRSHRALITGAGQGIGRACAEVFASRGADLVLLDRNAETLEEAVRATEQLGAEVTPVVLDLTHSEVLPKELERVQSGTPVDILVNNAGFDRPGDLSKIDRQDFESVLAIQLTAPLLLMKCLLPGMRSAGWGRIINVSSIYGLIGAKGEIAYSTVKAGLIGLTKSVAKEAGQDGVTVNAVLPGLTRTPTIENFMAARYKDAIIKDTPLGRMGEPEEIAHVIAFLASEEASFITAAVIPVSGGWGI
jgi:NAD(P)-dependent dehydrogenase (short-subunit alcohol dehydrogenase family)